MKTKTQSRNIVLAYLLMLTMIFSLFCSEFLFAGGNSTANAYSQLMKTLSQGCIDTTNTTNPGISITLDTGSVKNFDYSTRTYKKKGGGFFVYSEMWVSPGHKATIDEQNLGQLTQNAKKAFLTDVFQLANACVDAKAITCIGNTTLTFDSKTTAGSYGAIAITSDTVNDFILSIQDMSGIGTSLLTSILQNTKPDYVTANRIYEPFSGVIGTILGFLSIIIMALVGVSMALDIAYLTIPAFNMFCGGTDSNGNQGEKKSTIGGLISKEAKKAYQAADAGGGQGGQGGSGEFKAAVGVYFKYRWVGLLILGICLLYLVQGQIYTLIAWIIDLVSGFLDF